MSISSHAIYSTPEEVAASFKTDVKEGLRWTECNRRLLIHGHNEFKSEDSPRILERYLEQLKNPLIQLLLASVVISLFMGQFDDAFSITLAILIVISVALVQEYRSEKSLKELNKLVPPSCRVIRDGRYEELLAKYLVPGDIILISSGDRVPADVRLIECQDLRIDESSLTGETEALLKSTTSRKHDSTHIANNSISNNVHNNNNNNDFHNNNYKAVPHEEYTKIRIQSDQLDIATSECLAFMGTLVQSGNGRGIVVATGESTQFGKIFKLMQAEDSPKSPLQLNMDELGKHLSMYSLCIIAVIVLIGWFQSRPLVEMFTIGVSLGVAAVPEGLPIVVTVTLALGVMRMAKRNAVVKQLQAVETLGCVHVICSDKTGTLTKNEMTVTHILTSEFYQLSVSGIGYEDPGEIVIHDYNLDQTVQLQSVKRLLTAGSLCNNARNDHAERLIGQSTEIAILVAARKCGLQGVREEYQRVEEMPFNSEHKYMAVRCRQSKGDNILDSGNNKGAYYVKGAIEIILDKCNHYSELGTLIELTESRKKDIMNNSEMLESQGLRVLAIASGESLGSLTFLGLVGILDPPRAGVKEALDVLREGGIKIKMVTGDSKITAQSIAKTLGFDAQANVMMSGKDIDNLVSETRLSSAEKADRFAHTSIFYRVTPQHKMTIVKMLQSIGYITAMTGDGVNDGVALKRSNIGIAMGKSGTDVCKEAADVILMDDNLATIVVALEEGKGIYHNIRNFIRFQLSTSIAALSLIALSTTLHIPNPLNAMQILYINILMDGPPAQSLGVETVDEDVLKQPPRDVKESVITLELLVSVLVSATTIVIGTLAVFISEMSDGIVTPRDTTMTFTCFVLFDLFNALSCRSQTKLIFDIGLFTNKAFIYSVGGSLVGQLLVIYTPPFQRIFQTEALSLTDLIFLLSISSTVFIVSELLKLFKNRTLKRRLLHSTSMYLV